MKRITDIKIMNSADRDRENKMEIFMMSVYFVSMWKQVWEDLEVNDKYYPMVVCAMVEKCGKE